MKIIISEIPEDGLELELKENIFSDAVKILSEIHAFLRIDRKDSGVLVKGTLSGDVELQCSRCLKDFSANIKSSIDVVYHPVEDIRKVEHHELKGDELDTIFYKGDVLDTDNLLIEQLILNMPMKPLCSSQCKGICPKCGTDLNTAQCGCETKDTEQRFEILKQLLTKKGVN
jgi:uncharacterized protein